MGYFLRAKLAVAWRLRSSDPDIWSKTIASVQQTLSNHLTHVQSSPWRSLPELTNKVQCHQCPSRLQNLGPQKNHFFGGHLGEIGWSTIELLPMPTSFLVFFGPTFHFSQASWRILDQLVISRQYKFLSFQDGVFCPGSCPAQAWSVGCILEVMHDLNKYESNSAA